MTDRAFQEEKKKITTSRKIAGLTITFCLFLVACLSTPIDPTLTPFPEPASTETNTPTYTPTVIWFPPTGTPTPFADIPPTSTAFPLPPLGEIVLTDDFADENLWSLTQSTRGSAALGINELTIVLNEPRAYVSATRVDIYLTDYFLEATAATSLCAAQDEYGMILRAASPSDFYRLSLSCDGQLRLDQIRGGTATSPLPWTISAAVPRNAPGVVKIGVWADGGVMHIFLNDVYQVSVNTPLLPGGTIGFFSRSSGQNAVTVNFSDLSVWSLER